MITEATMPRLKIDTSTLLEHVRLTLLTGAAFLLALACASEAHQRAAHGEPSCLTQSR